MPWAAGINSSVDYELNQEENFLFCRLGPMRTYGRRYYNNWDNLNLSNTICLRTTRSQKEIRITHNFYNVFTAVNEINLFGLTVFQESYLRKILILRWFQSPGAVKFKLQSIRANIHRADINEKQIVS